MMTLAPVPGEVGHSIKASQFQHSGVAESFEAIRQRDRNPTRSFGFARQPRMNPPRKLQCLVQLSDAGAEVWFSRTRVGGDWQDVLLCAHKLIAGIESGFQYHVGWDAFASTDVEARARAAQATGIRYRGPFSTSGAAFAPGLREAMDIAPRELPLSGRPLWGVLADGDLVDRLGRAGVDVRRLEAVALGMKQGAAFVDRMNRVNKEIPVPEAFDFRDPTHVGAVTSEVVLNVMLETPELTGLWGRVGRPGQLPPSGALPDGPAIFLVDDRWTPSWWVADGLQRAGVAEFDAFRAVTALIRDGAARVPVANPTAAAVALTAWAQGESSGLRISVAD